MLSTYEQRSKLKLTATIVTILVIAGVVLFADFLKSHNKSTAVATLQSTPTTSIAPSTSAASSSSTSTTTSSSSSGYKDGTFTATSGYYVPHGEEEIQVNLTLSGGTITNSSIVNSESDNASARYQEDFAAEYKTFVIGKKIGSLHLDKVSGASDTTQGFNNALSQIASQAKA